MSRQRMRARARSEIDQPHGRVLRRARHKQMLCDGRERMRVYDRAEIEVCGEGERVRGVELEVVVVGGGEEGCGVEGVET
jgi:hypothetical protein